MEDTVIVFVNGREETWPKREYLDYKAWQLGFEDYDDLKAQNYKLKEE